MPRTEIISTGFHVPDNVVTNQELTEWWDTSDEWIRERTGIEQRYWVNKGEETTSDLAVKATEKALAAAGMEATEIDAIVFATLSPDYYFPGGAVFLQDKLGMGHVPALDVRNQCTGFVYGLSVADAWIRAGMYQRVLLVGAEVQSIGLDYSPAGRDLGVLFGDGAGVAILGPTEDDGRGVLSTHLFSDGRHAEKLWLGAEGSADFPRVSVDDVESGKIYPTMEGREVFKNAVKRMPESVITALEHNGLGTDDVDLVIAHQANLRINEMVTRRLGLDDEQVYNNIQRYGNTTAATIPIAMHEAVEKGLLERGDLLILTAFGSGYTWGSAAIRW
jgi:3-oxoacyl-[acyl-carrier-protein] synthase-3